MAKKSSDAGTMRGTAIILLIIAAVIIAVGVIHKRDNKMLVDSCTGQTKGVVTNVLKTRERTGSRKYRRYKNVYHVDVKYTVKSRKYEVSTKESANRFTEGSRVTVMYNPDSPSESYIRGATMQDGNAEFITAAIIIVAALFYLSKSKRTKTTYNDVNINGETFEQWQARQQSETEIGIPDASTEPPPEAIAYGSPEYKRYSEDDYFKGNDNGGDYLGE